MNEIFHNIYKIEIDKMFNSSQGINSIRHNGVKGSIREYGLKEVLDKFLPTFLKVGTGVIQDCKGTESNQSDLIIYNKDILPPLDFKEIGVYPVESVIYNIEVKSVSTKEEVSTTVEKFKNLKCLNDSRINPYSIHTAYFAYDTNLKNKSELQRLAEIDNIFDPATQIICVAGDGYYFYRLREISKYVVEENGVSKYIDGKYLVQWQGIRSKGDYYEVMCFVAGILNTTRDFSIGEYILNDGWFEEFCQAVFDKDGKLLYNKINYDGIPKNEHIKVVI
ncbi:DUF6602 domain-containing protein [Clostridium paraputrificum]|uniref:DUF6602 domain-containing protein n=1 Tax=Clostridium paraputrificum TaxID=29363 RepID=UPI002672FB7F|nr:DUF6602 domain-containing protein [Clostridium paraputrificum]